MVATLDQSINQAGNQELRNGVWSFAPCFGTSEPHNPIDEINLSWRAG